MEEIRAGACLADIQLYVAQLEAERGFADQSATQKCLLLGEELGELFKAVRGQEGLPLDANSAVSSIAEELADLLIYVCAIANRYGIDLENAFHAKERLNATRTWRAGAADS